MKRQAESELESGARVVCIDAGGTLFKTTRQTLLQSAQHFPRSGLVALAEQPDDTVVQVDSDPELFRHILQLVRRPALAECAPPPFVWPAAWSAELDFWGLSERAQCVEERRAEEQQRAHQRNLRALQKIGEEARAQVLDNEVRAVRALLDKNGYTSSRNKGRDATLYVPLDRCALEDGLDLGRYLLENATPVAKLLQRIMAPCTVDIKQDKHVKNFAQYRFDGEDYTASKETPTLIVSIKFPLDSAIDNK